MNIPKTIVIIFLFILPLFGSEEKKKEEYIVSIINNYRPLILEKLKDTRFFSSRTGRNLFKLLSDPLNTIKLKENKQEIMSIIAIISKALPNKKFSKRKGFPCYFHTGFVEEEEFYRLWVDLFKCDDLLVKGVAHDILLGYSRRDYINKYSKEIRKSLEEYRKEFCEKENTPACQKRFIQNIAYKDIKEMLRGDELYMNLPLTEKEKKIMLTKKIPLHYRVRMGDKEAEKNLIAMFEKTTSPGTKGKIAGWLGLAGTKECAKALVRALNSPLHYKNKSGSYRSARVYIIIALGRIHQEVPFLRMDASFIEMHGDEVYGSRDKNQRYKEIQNYLDKVIKWAKKTYNIDPVDGPPEPVLIIHRMQTSRPPKGATRPKYRLDKDGNPIPIPIAE